MKIKRLIRLQTWMGIVLFVYALFAGYLFFMIPNPMPMRFSGAAAEREIKTADLSRLQGDLHAAVSYLTEFRHDRNDLLLLCLGATVAVVGFLGWSIFVINRVSREVGHAA